MNYNNELEIEYRALKKKINMADRYALYSLIGFILAFGSYFFLLIKSNSIDFIMIIIIVIAIGLISVYFATKGESYKFSVKELIIYDVQNLKNTIRNKERSLISKNFLELAKDLTDYTEYSTDDLHFKKNRKKVKGILNYLKDYIYPTLTQKNSEGEYCIYLEENKIILDNILSHLDNLTLSLLHETFLDYKLDKTNLIYEKTKLNSIEEHSPITKNLNYIKRLYNISLPFRYTIHFLVIFSIIYSINEFSNIIKISEILIITAAVSAGMTRL
jgi:hypothetical protein